MTDPLLALVGLDTVAPDAPVAVASDVGFSDLIAALVPMPAEGDELALPDHADDDTTPLPDTAVAEESVAAAIALPAVSIAPVPLAADDATATPDTRASAAVSESKVSAVVTPPVAGETTPLPPAPPGDEPPPPTWAPAASATAATATPARSVASPPPASTPVPPPPTTDGTDAEHAGGPRRDAGPVPQNPPTADRTTTAPAQTAAPGPPVPATDAPADPRPAGPEPRSAVGVAQPPAPTPDPGVAAAPTPAGPRIDDARGPEADPPAPGDDRRADTGPSTITDPPVHGTPRPANGGPGIGGRVPSEQPHGRPAGLEKVVDAIRELAGSRPPRSIAVRLDHLGGLRVTVSLRSDGIHLSIPGARTEHQALLGDLTAALSREGFDLAGSSWTAADHQPRHQPHPDDTDTYRPPAPPSRRPRRTEADDAVRL